MTAQREVQQRGRDSELRVVEQRRRRALAWSLTGVLGLGVAPLALSSVAEVTRSWFVVESHLGLLCLAALHALLAPLSAVLQLLLVAGLVYATVERWRALRRQRWLTRALTCEAIDPESRLGREVREVGLHPDNVRLVSGLPTPALTVGLLAPRVLLSERLVSLLDARQLRAVLAHEAAHLRSGDPLRMSLLRFAARVFFWLPVVERLAADWSEEMEILSDDAAVARLSTEQVSAGADPGPLVVASALTALARAFAVDANGHRALVGVGVGVAHGDAPGLLERRIRRLVGETPLVRGSVPRRQVTMAVAALALWWAGSFPLIHPLPASSEVAGHHCDHSAMSVLRHAICRCESDADDDHCAGSH